jgi:DNA gyrase subunit A
VAGRKVPAGAEVVSLSAVDAGDEGEVLTVGADATVKRSPLGDYPAKGRGGKGLVTGVEELLYCGVAVDLHLAGDPLRVVRPVDAPEARRAGRGTTLEGTVTAPVVAEVGVPAS